MNIVLTLDYEIWFGRNARPATQTLVEPTDALRLLARRHDIRLVVFVDVLWLSRLREASRRHPPLVREHDAVARQLDALAAEGHELQLHLHPHWVDSHWQGGRWDMNMARYRLHDFPDDQLAQLVHSGCQVLRQHARGGSVSAFRAGGWCLQPFSKLHEPLRAAGIRIDSTVYAGGAEHGAGRQYDFTAAPRLSRWRFELDPLQPQEDGSFLEVPIASMQLGPAFYWRLALTKAMRRGRHRPYSPGSAMPMSRADRMARLLRPGTSVVSFDGLKASLLSTALEFHRRGGLRDFVVIGHPKALTPYGLAALDRFVAGHRHECFRGLSDYLELLADKPVAGSAA